MMPLSLVEILESTKGELITEGNKKMITSISVDTRTLKRGDFFIPLKGPNFDGHQFLRNALEKGASGFITENWDRKQQRMLKEELLQEATIIKVEDSLEALQNIAKFIRQKLSVRVVGITGSTGKTCTKDMLASILQQKKKVIASRKNYNNEVGVPLTILEAGKDTEVLVVEMAMRALGEIKELADVALPNIGIVTNVGRTHYELLGSVEAIGFAKGELVKAIPEGGVVVLNNDDDWTTRFISETGAKVVTFGKTREADVSAACVKVDMLGKPTFKLITDKGEADVSIPYPGRHLIENALAAAAAALELELSLADVKRGLENCELAEMRMQVIHLPNKVVVVNDAYNANPASMKAALLTLKDIRKLRGIAILGDMLELGAIAAEAHREIGKVVCEIGVDLLITVGEKARLIACEAERCGMPKDTVFSFSKVKEACKLLKDKIKPGDVILIKASRAIGLEKVVESLDS